MPDMLKRYCPTLAIVALLALLSLAGCSSTVVEIPLSNGQVAKLSSHRIFVSTAASVDLTDPTTGAALSGSYSSDPQAQQAQEALAIAAKALQLAAPGP